MIEHVIKRNGSRDPFDSQKITNAVLRAMESLDESYRDQKLAEKVSKRVVKKMKDWNVDVPTVDMIHILVENSLMDMKLYELAREYITYREANKPDIFRKREALEPEEYPKMIEFVDAINISFWRHNKFDVTSDIHDFDLRMSKQEKCVTERAMLAISQIENAVKRFWGNVGNHMPKPEIERVGVTFAENEIRHERSYKLLLEKLGLKERFERIYEIPCMKKRVKYLKKANENAYADDPKDYFESIILFSMFVENVSLFSQFLIIMSINHDANMLKGMSNVVEATTKEEVIHALFGFELIQIIKDENPDWFDDELQEYIREMVDQAHAAEMEIIDWIYEEGDIDYIPKESVKEYVKYRLNLSLNAIGMDDQYALDDKKLESVIWFDQKLELQSNTDFFYKRKVEYNKDNDGFNIEEDIF